MINNFAYLAGENLWQMNSNFNPDVSEIHHQYNFSAWDGWICPKFGHEVSRHCIIPKHNLDHPNPFSVARGTAGSVKFDGPSMPSEVCSPSCSSTTGPIHLVVVYSWPPNTTLTYLHKYFQMNLGSSQNGRGRPQKGKTAGFFLELGHFRLCEGAVTLWEPFKSDIMKSYTMVM